MRKIIGNHVSVFLKTGKKDEQDIFGILLDVSDDSVFLQVDANIFVIPRDNINYYVTDCIPQSEMIIASPSEKKHSVVLQQQNDSVIDSLKVYVDNNIIVDIPVPPTFDLQNWHEGILRIAMGNPETQASLIGKVQKEINYSPGMVYITTVTEEECFEPDHKQNIDKNQTSFSMGGDPTSQFVNPLQMVARLQNFGTKKAKINDKDKI